jgi:hypothetical protein
MKRIWYSLLDSTGNPYLTVDFVEVSRDAIAGHVRKQVWTEPNTLTGVDAAQLKVYGNKAAFESKENPIEIDKPVVELESNSTTNPLVVVVPLSNLRANL